MAPYPDKKSAQDENHATLIYDLGYCFDFFKALSVVDMALEHDDLEKKYQILSQLARPYETLAAENPQEDDTKTVSSPYFQSHAEKDACPLNEKIDTKLCAEQDEIVGNLVRPVEIIQGPPGTGKSTLIRSIARKQIPWRSDNITLILAVQNKATDVLVEGFAPFVDNQPQETRMLVMGSSTNPKMGPSAKHYTLDSLLPKTQSIFEHLKVRSTIMQARSLTVLLIVALCLNAYLLVSACACIYRLQGCCPRCRTFETQTAHREV
jgi:predicted ATPase